MKNLEKTLYWLDRTAAGFFCVGVGCVINYFWVSCFFFALGASVSEIKNNRRPLFPLWVGPLMLISTIIALCNDHGEWTGPLISAIVACAIDIAFNIYLIYGPSRK